MIRILGFVFIIAAVVVAILNLHRVANLGMTWLTPLLIILAVVFIVAGKRKATQ